MKELFITITGAVMGLLSVLLFSANRRANKAEEETKQLTDSANRASQETYKKAHKAMSEVKPDEVDTKNRTDFNSGW